MKGVDDYTRVIISDLHLGSVYSKEAELSNFLDSIEFDEIILAGDIIEFLRVPTFTKGTLAIFKKLTTSNKKIIYVVGNHDDAFENFVGEQIAGIEFVRQYDFLYAGRRYRVQHGDQYDSGVIKWRYTIEFISLIQNIIERVFRINLTSWWAKRQIKKRKLIWIWDIVQWNDDADVFIMGHTHNPEVLIWVDKEECIKTYINTGDWIDNCTYVIVKDNQVRLRKYQQAPD